MRRRLNIPNINKGKRDTGWSEVQYAKPYQRQGNKDYAWKTPPKLPHSKSKGKKINMPTHKSRSQARSPGQSPCPQDQEEEQAQRSPTEVSTS